METETPYCAHCGCDRNEVVLTAYSIGSDVPVDEWECCDGTWNEPEPVRLVDLVTDRMAPKGGDNA